MTTAQGPRGIPGPQGPDGERGGRGEHGSGTAKQLRSLAVIVLILMAFTGANVYWTSQIAKGEGQKWCSLLITLDNADQHQKVPPQTQFGKNLVTDFRELRRGFDCG